jgi:hypothetical protein
MNWLMLQIHIFWGVEVAYEVVWLGGRVGEECVDQLTYVLLQVDVVDRWVWKLHHSQRYTIKSVYNNLTTVDVNFNMGFNHMLWLKAVPLKINIFVWRLFLNQIPTKDNLL